MFKVLKNYFLYQYYKLKKYISPDKKYISGKCQKCGKCCRELGLFYNGIPLTDLKDFDELYGPYPEYSVFKFKKKAPNGQLIFTCKNLTKNNKCADHKNRPDICRNYPFINSQIRYKKQLKNCGFTLNHSLNFKETMKMQIIKTNLNVPSSSSKK